MSRKIVTPPINVRGTFICAPPYELPANTVYYCAAIRTHSELAKRQIDVFTDFYASVGLSEREFKDDVAMFASIVTLISPDGDKRYVPNTYILSYPGINGISYDNKVLLIKLGLTPSDLNIDYVKEEIAAMVHSAVGVTAEPEVVTVPYDQPITYEQSIQLEMTRATTIRLTETLVSQNNKLKEQVAGLITANKEFEAIIESLTKT